MPGKPKILVVGEADEELGQFLQHVDDFEIVHARTPLRALAELARHPFAAVHVAGPHVGQVPRLGRLLEQERLLENSPDGVVLLRGDNVIVWANRQFTRWCRRDDVVGTHFYSALGGPDILGPDFSPFRSVRSDGTPSRSTLRTGEGQYFQIHAAVVPEDGDLPESGAGPASQASPTQTPALRVYDGIPQPAETVAAEVAELTETADPAAADQGWFLIVTVRDVTSEMLHQQKLEKIHAAGRELNDLSPEALTAMTVDDRIELLKSNILQVTKDVLNFDVVEVRMLDHKQDRLEPLLAVGMTSEAAARDLFARTQNNGVTGFVGATGQSYLCVDTTTDPHYLEGCEGAKSSLTVPLRLNDQVIGTFNVESTRPHAFTAGDLQFVEIFCRDLAVAVNTLELLNAERAITAAEGVEAIHSAVALPVDEILNDAVNVMEHYIGHDAEVVERLQRILRNARDIKEVIQEVGQTMAPSDALPVGATCEQRPLLKGRRILVADADDSVRGAAHTLLERYGCVVETAPTGAEAISMIRNTGADAEYDVIIADIRLSDMTGYDLLMKLREFKEAVPLVLMTGFGYDPGHSIVKARQAGLQEVLYKPFRLDQLLGAVERTVGIAGPVA